MSMPSPVQSQFSKLRLHRNRKLTTGTQVSRPVAKEGSPQQLSPIKPGLSPSDTTRWQAGI